MRPASNIARTCAAAALAAALLVSPAPAMAQAVTDADTGTTEVTVQAGPGWGQKTETVSVRRGTKGALARTGDAPAWAAALLAGAAALSGGLLANLGDRNGEEAEDGPQA